MRKKLIHIILLVLVPLWGFLQKPNFEFVNIGIKNGLSHNNVYAIEQDAEGYIWIGTQDGLNKYDGYNFTVFRHDPSDSNTISSNNFGKIYQDSSGTLWLGTYGGGLDAFNPVTYQIKHYKHDEKILSSISTDRIQFIHVDIYGLMWIGTSKGLNLFDRETGKFIHFLNVPDDSNSISHNRVKAIAEEKNGKLWIGTGKGLNLLNRKTGTFKHFMHDSTNPESISHDHIQSIIVDQEGIIWLGGRGGGLNRFDPATKTFKHYKHDPKNPFSISDNNVEYIFEDSEHHLWIGTYSGGLNLFDREKEVFYHYINNPNNPLSIAYNRIEYIFEDKTKVLWIGTRGAGISKLDLKMKHFNHILYTPEGSGILPHPSIYSICEDHNGNLWIGTDGNGLVKYNPSSGSTTLFNKNAKQNIISSNRIWSLLVDSKGVIWVGTYGGGMNRILEKKDGSYLITHITSSRSNPNSLQSKQINAIIEDHNKKIWVATKRALSQLISDPLGATFEFKNYIHQPDKVNSISDNYISTVYEDSYGYIWAGTYISGLNRIDIESGNIKRFLFDPHDSNSVSDNRIQSIHEDKNKTLWVGTEGAGLNKYNRKTQNFTRILQQNPDYSNVIMGILEDDHQNLWISTSGGILKFNTLSNSFEKKYDINNGLYNQGFNRNACYTTKDKTMYFGTLAGLTYFKPDEITDNPFKPNVLLTDFKIFNVSLQKISASRYKYFRLNKNVNLDFNENSFSIEFCASDYSSVGKNSFKYMMEGFDDNWQEADYQHKATYTNLYPGNYNFLVKAANNDGVWNSIPASIQIKINPPLYLSAWFIATCILLTMSLVYAIIMFRIKKVNKDKQILEAKVAARTHQINLQKEELKKANDKILQNARLKELFLANTSHEIRTPLNVIIGFTNLLLNSSLELKQKNYLSHIKNSSNNLLVLINDILDFSKIEADKLILEEIRFDFRKTIQTILAPLLIKSEGKNINLKSSIHENVPKEVTGDPARLNQIIVNLIGNSIKFTNTGGYINLSIELIESKTDIHKLLLSVEDNGIGIPEDKTEKIFESFSQASNDTSRKYGGTGLGLSIVKRLVDLHNGSISVISKPGKGSKFTLTLEYKNVHSQRKVFEVKSNKEEDISNTDKLKILLVEDNLANQTLAIDTIHMFNSKIHIDIAENGKEAIKKLEASTYNLVIMDIQMPEMNGYEATKYIRNELTDETKNIPILGMSAHAMKTDRDKCIALGMNDYITKPFNPNVFFNKILELTGSKKVIIADSNQTYKVPEIRTKIIDLFFLFQTYKGDSKKIMNILNLYLKNTPQQLNDFIDAVQNNKLVKIKTSAHTLKTSFKYLGANSLHVFFKEIEQNSITEKTTLSLLNKIQWLKSEWKQSMSEIKAIIKKM